MKRACSRLGRLLVALASRVVPREKRSRFRQEWEAEIVHRARSDASLGSAVRNLRRAAGAFSHALFMFREGWRWDMVAQDVRYAVRTLGQAPLFVASATLTLAIGIGANAALFSVIDAVLLRPLPYPEPERLVSLFESRIDLGGTRDGPAPGNVIDWMRESRTLEEIAAWWIESTTLLGDDYGDTEEVPSAYVTAGFFPALGIEPAIGRTFAPEEVSGAPTLAVLSYELWQKRFGGDERVVGRDVRFKNSAWRIVGVMPPEFRTPGTLPGEVQLFKPWDLEYRYGAMPGRARDHRFLRSVARLAPGVSIEDAQAELDVIAAGIAEANPKTNRGWGVALVPLRDALVGNARVALLALLAAVVFVLLLACVNVTSLLLVRGSGRGREMAVRSALGASRLRLVRQLFLESFLLAALGGLLGFGLAHFGVAALVRLAPAGVPGIENVALDSRVALFALLASVTAGFVAGLAPAFQSSTALPVEALRGASGSVSADRPRQRLRGLLVGLEIAAALVLLVGSGLFLKSFSRVVSVELGFDPANLLVVRMRLDAETYGGGGAHPYYTRFLEEIRALPGVVAAGGTTALEMDELDVDFDRPFWRDGEPRPDGGGAGVQIRMATVGYFDAMRIPLVDGRDVDPRDDRTKPRVLIVNETMARQTWPGESPLGKRLYIDYQSYEAVYEVVGVVGDTRSYGHKAEPRRAVYIPHAQNAYLPLNLVVRTRTDPAALAPAVRRAALALDPAQPVHSIRTMEELVSSYLGSDRFAAFLMSVFAAMALVLAAIGVYGIVAFSVGQRQRELGLRLALGAEASDITRLVLGGGLRLGAVGTLAGLVAALLAGRAIESALFGTSPADPGTLAVSALVLLATVLLACFLPARRAARVDPTRTLRTE